MKGAAKPTDSDEFIFQYCEKCQRIHYAKPTTKQRLINMVSYYLNLERSFFNQQYFGEHISNQVI